MADSSRRTRAIKSARVLCTTSCVDSGIFWITRLLLMDLCCICKSSSWVSCACFSSRVIRPSLIIFLLWRVLFSFWSASMDWSCRSNTVWISPTSLRRASSSFVVWAFPFCIWSPISVFIDDMHSTRLPTPSVPCICICIFSYGAPTHIVSWIYCMSAFYLSVWATDQVLASFHGDASSVYFK